MGPFLLRQLLSHGLLVQMPDQESGQRLYFVQLTCLPAHL